ncbi:MAG: B12-binding domain-containing radical SAM protein [Actinobacteria bacterium]|nr:B12-binding domain-containing radical SAM protein [Actinomycetota bacterium]
MVQILDGYSIGSSASEIREAVRSFQPQIVGISSLTPQWPDAEKVAVIVKGVNKNICTAVGGPHVTALPAEAASHHAVDIAVVGEGEETMQEICDAVAAGSPIGNIAGTVSMNGGNIPKHNPGRARNSDLDSLPFPAHDLLPEPARYNPYPAWGNRGKFSCIISGRGCPYRCSFCDVTSQQGRRYRLRSAENIVDEISWLNLDFGVTTFSFRDPSMICDRNRLMEICRLIEEKNLSIAWTCSARANEIDPEMLAAMKKAGCRLMQYGIEVGNAEMLLKIKKISKARVAEAVRQTRGAGILAHGYFLFGFLEETKETIAETISFAKELKLDSAGFAVMVPFPGTEEFEKYSREGLLIMKDWRDYVPTGVPVYRHRNVTHEDLVKATRQAYREFYLRPRIIAKHIHVMKNYHTLNNYLRSARQFLF